MNQTQHEHYEYAWPMLSLYSKPLSIMIKNSHYSFKTIALPSQIVEYLLIVCDKLKVSNASLHLTLSLASRFLKKRPNALPLQLVVLSCLLIATKFIETNPLQVNQLHKWSCNSFTSRDFYRTEKTILNELNFQILNEGIGDCEIRMVVHCIKHILDSEFVNIFVAIVQDLQRMVWFYIYTGRLKMREGRDRLITAAIIHLALIFLTQFSGKFLQTLWACQLTGTEEKEVITLSNRLLKEILGEEKCKLYQL